jgi:heavy metal-binding protein
MTSGGFAVLLASAIVGLAGVSAAQLPPISWTCPMHPDVLEDTKGKCNICGMDLEPVRLVTVWKCPVHGVIEESTPGKCRICSRPLVATTMALTWTCAGNKQISQIDPGSCQDKSPMIAKYTPRAHGDHNPKHGGFFFMAPDNWHHIEGTYPAPGRFRLYVYDDFSKPLALDKLRGVRARVVTKEVFDPKTKTTRELAATPLVLGRNGAFFEARISQPTLPAQMTAKISFVPGDKENRFDFTFPSVSKDQPSPAAPPAIRSAERSKGLPAGASDNTVATLLADLKTRQAELSSLVKSGSFGGIYAPALEAKDLALQIQSKAASQHAIEGPVRQLVVSAYQLDNYGDLGDREKINEAYLSFNAAVSALESLIARR